MSACNLTFEDLKDAKVGGALLDNYAKCRDCKRLASKHDKSSGVAASNAASVSLVSHSVPPFDINVALDAASMVNMGLQTRPDPIPVGGEYFGFVPNESLVNRAALDSELVRYMGGFMDGRVGDGEEGLISRNDSFCNIFVKLANMDKYSRNKHEDSTALTTRADRTDKYEGVSLVMTEEKAEGLNGAIEDLKRKIRWIPHFEKLPFVFGIAIGGHQLQIYAIDSNINMNCLFSADLNVMVERWNCIIAAINMARVINSFVHRKLIIPSTLRFDIWNRRNNKKIRLQLNCAEVEFPHLDTFNRMVRFYEATVNVKNIEHMFEYNEEKMRVKLNPVGVNRKPDSYAELVAAMKSICDCLFELHQVHYFHCDVRWDNIICVLGAWYLIDCEYACHESEIGLLSSRSSNDIKRTHVKFPTQSWDSTFDLYQVGLLLDDPEMIRFTENTRLLELKTMLKSKKPSVAAIKRFLTDLK